jgi:uncharacterized Zn finger protein (UPF0148 family)
MGRGEPRLVAWELCVGEDDVAEAWAELVESGQILAAGTCPKSGEELMRLAGRVVR